MTLMLLRPSVAGVHARAGWRPTLLLFYQQTRSLTRFELILPDIDWQHVMFRRWSLSPLKLVGLDTVTYYLDRPEERDSRSRLVVFCRETMVVHNRIAVD
jgi:hypothetical protein